MNGTFGRFRQLVSTLLSILLDPTSNLKTAAILYAIIAVVLLIVLVIGMMFVMATPEDDATDEVTRSERKRAKGKRRPATPLSPIARLLLGLAMAGVLVSVWVLAGFNTSGSELCKSCHWPASEHAKADRNVDPHAGVDCVSCHESGGAIERYVTGVPARALHIASAWGGMVGDTGYGRVMARSCNSCHSASTARTTSNAERGLKMSHAEPLAAAATCTDCHAMRNGVVSIHNTGMKPCLRCHDDVKASSACVTCHAENAAAAARARTTSFQGVQIREVTCGGCHNEKRDCDTCHGVRMPHSTDFKAHSHARAAAVDFWFNDGKLCRGCHTTSRRPCRCHSESMGHAHGSPTAQAQSHQGASSKSCDTCHLYYAPVATRDFCKDICHSPAAIAASPR